jgi:hypothetical protein
MVASMSNQPALALFWESVKTSFAETQVIIIENSDQLPGDGTLSDVNVVLFTGNDQGRRGFIPRAEGTL